MTSKITLLVCCIAAILISPLSYAQGQTSVSGSVKNASTKEGVSAVTVSIKGTNILSFTDDRGNFKFSTIQKPPFTLIISSIGFVTKEIEFNGQPLEVDLVVSYALGDEVVVSATRTSQKLLEAPVSIDIVSRNNIRNTPGGSYYDALNHLKGVDITTSSYTFKTVSTRGFNGSGNLRFNQMVDGMDNTTPALNFSVGNVIGLTELDVDNMELLSGASSALYGSGGMNGTLLINSKDPFKYSGVSFQIKQGVMHIGDSRSGATPFYDWSLRWGVKVSDKFAFKVGAEYVKADDWQADDSTNLLRNNVISKTVTGSRSSDPNYDGVNVYGDEVSSGMESFAQAAIFSAQLTDEAKGLMNSLIGGGYSYTQIQQILGSNPQTAPLNQILPFYMASATGVYGAQAVSRTGYNERNLVDYGAKNLKFSGGLYWNVNSSVQASLTANWGSGTSVYTGADRYSLKNFAIGQYKLEFKSKNWFLRGYTTQENSGDSYASTLTAIAINNAWKADQEWFAEYVGTYSDQVLKNVPDAQAHAIARTVAETGRYAPGTKEFQAAFDKSVKTSISDGGSQFADKSSLWQFEGQANLTPYIKVVDVLVGASYRWYNLNSQGTIFADTSGKIKIGELGGYVQLQKRLFKDVLALSASGRYDKNDNFDGRFTPRVTATIKVAKDNHIRMSYQQAYRFPTNQDQWINLQTPGSVLIGCLPGFNDYYKFSSNPVWTSESILAYRTDFATHGVPNPTLLKVAEFEKAKPESVESFELGYRGIIAKKLLVDAYIYTSKYKDFIARTAVGRGASGDPATSFIETLNPLSTANFSFVTNSTTPVKANGWGIGLDYQLGRKGYKVMANIYSDEIKDIPVGLVTFFNTPKTRYNLGFANANVYKGLGFNVLYKWQDNVYWEGTFGTGTIPSFGTVDLLLSYKIGKSSNLIKLGATNLFNNYYRNAFGNPYIGGLYYVSFGYNVF